jgi:hypothetical protein
MKTLHAPTRSFHLQEEEYQYLNDTTENSNIDEEDEDFVFTSSISSKKGPSLNNSDSKRKPFMYNELVESSQVREYMDLVAQGNKTRQWQYVFHFLFLKM